MKDRSFPKIMIRALCLSLAVLICSSHALAKSPAAVETYTPPPAQQPSEISKFIGYDKGLFIATEDEKFKMKFNVQLQPQLQFLSMENQPDAKSFQIRRMRFYLTGHAFNPKITYKIASEFGSGRTNNTVEGVAFTGFNLREAFVEYKFNDHFQLRSGEFKIMNNREELSSSSQLQFVDRTINNDVFTLTYDLGVALLGKFGSMDKIEYALYVANEGNNRNTFDVNNEPLVGGRLTWNALGNHGFTQADINDTQDRQLAFGVTGNYNKPGLAANNTLFGTGADAALRYKGFSFVTEGNYARNNTTKLNVFGGMAQTGYFLVPKRFEVAARGATVIPTAANVVNGYEFGGCLSYYFIGHNVKLQTDYAMLVNSPLTFGGGATARNFMTTGTNPTFNQNQNDHRLRTQLQLYF